MRGFFNFIFSRLFLCLLLIAAYLSAITFLCYYIPSLLSFGAAVAGVYLLSAVVALFLINRDVPPEYKCAWLCFIAAVPVVGAVMYVLFQYRRMPCERTLDFAGEGQPAAGYDYFCYFPDGASYFERLFSELEKARKFIWLEYYIFAEGEIFSRLYDCLKRALGRGVQVRLIADGLGSALRLPRAKLKDLRRRGAEFKIFHRLFPLSVSRLNYRDHRKIAAIDGRIAFSGGINIADEYAGITSPHGYWKDTGFCVSGEAAEVFAELFLSVWSGCREAALPHADGAAGRLTPVFDSPPVKSGMCEDVICAAIYGAKQRIWAFTPYLSLDERIKRALAYAASKGVDVKIVIPHIPDKKPAFALTRAYAAELKERGVQVYEFTPGFMHAKCLICDDECLLGSYNLDFRSMWLNYECGALFDGRMTEDVAADFTACLALSEPSSARRKKWTAALFKLFAPLA